VINRANLLVHLVLVGFILGFLPLPRTAPEALSAVDTPTPPQGEVLLGQTGAEPLIETLESLPQTRRSDPWNIVVLKLALAGALGLILAHVYRASYTGKRKKYNPSMMQSQILLCIGGAMIWIIVANNIVRAFGLAGALSLIRYRTVVRDPKDTVVVFLSMLVGMACGLGQYAVAPIATAFIIIVLFAMHEFRVGEKKKKKKKKPETEESVPEDTSQD